MWIVRLQTHYVEVNGSNEMYPGQVWQIGSISYVQDLSEDGSLIECECIVDALVKNEMGTSPNVVVLSAVEQ